MAGDEWTNLICALINLFNSGRLCLTTFSLGPFDAARHVGSQWFYSLLHCCCNWDLFISPFNLTKHVNPPKLFHFSIILFTTFVSFFVFGAYSAYQHHEFVSSLQFCGSFMLTTEPLRKFNVQLETSFRNLRTDVNNLAHRIVFDSLLLGLGSTSISVSYKIDLKWTLVKFIQRPIG